ncbi:hypothetical protein [Mycolicibacterium litorale]|uniref:PE-PGRS family protein n=1 Tax=Mycolicibacterium litorale TaxID=758802 RepID=A0AAD1IR23_9MYCO|nr:hypothetical protein [Mycolicibacterium litorale]MCV7418289.1 hypothetical protein [Mycolicibacterium litorale]TDY06318.1 hypothetical protein BCL50_2636 [Mycolicibacterium litorale]BBY19536.1 hypothetical protein MLIT_51280 [Mycolicibacterium litorale]
MSKKETELQLALRPYVTAGVAIVGASVIAATPITAAAPDIQHRAVTLSAAVQTLDLPSPADITPFAAALADSSFVNPITRWAEVFELTASNLTELFQNAAAEPFPVLRQIIENQMSYGELIGTSLLTVVQNIINTVTIYVPDYLEEARAEFEAGDIMGVGNVMSRATLTVASSLFPMLNFFSIPNQMVGNLSSVLELLTFKSFRDVGLVGQVGMGYVSLVQGFVSQGAARIGQNLYDAIQDGDLVKLASTIINAPADIVSAILNGSYVPPNRPGRPGSWTSGLFSPDRMYAPLHAFLIDIPRAIAAAIAPPVAAPRETPAPRTAPEPEALTAAPEGEGAEEVSNEVAATVEADEDTAAAPVLDADETVIDTADWESTEETTLDDVVADSDESVDDDAADDLTDPADTIGDDAEETTGTPDATDPASSDTGTDTSGDAGAEGGTGSE